MTSPTHGNSRWIAFEVWILSILKSLLDPKNRRYHQLAGDQSILRPLFLTLILLSPIAGATTESICYGTTADGRLENGVKLPYKGENFQAYSLAGHVAGRTYVHSRVYEIVVSSYQALAVRATNKTYLYGETGRASGGIFKPHKTHQNGLSVDFMVPVIKDGKSVHLPTSVFNKLGYNIEFNLEGRYRSFTIDYDAMASHLVELHKAALQNKVGIWRVIFDPKLQPFLFKTQDGEYLQKHLTFSQKPSWVRHDEHYHVDFIVDCG